MFVACNYSFCYHHAVSTAQDSAVAVSGAAIIAIFLVAFMIIFVLLGVALAILISGVSDCIKSAKRKLTTNHKYVHYWQIFITVLMWFACSPLRESGGVHTQPAIEESGSSETTQHAVVLRGSLKAKIPPSLNITSTNLRVSDPIGQGKLGGTKFY